MKQPIVAFLSGTVFAVGLVVAGMTDRLRVRAFLDIAGDWDPRLMLVMVFGIGVFAPVYRMGRARAVGEGAAKVYSLPTSPIFDPKLIGGAILFGIGWGIVGFCPGPALVALGAAIVRFDPTPIIFVLAMVVGMVLHTALMRALAKRAEREDA